jgi:hypothetical protein
MPPRSLFPRPQPQSITQMTRGLPNIASGRTQQETQLLCAPNIKAFDIPRLDAGSNTSTVALQIIGGDDKGTQCLGV